ncbi:peptide ABC transporter permease [Escherichia coli]|nr:peptide ABC transporter permease [Escherichia coli]
MSDTTELVDLAVIFPDLEIELKYACADNITGKAIYQQARCLLHKDAITALAKSISIAQLSGLQLVIYDAYRPQQAQAMLWQACPDPQYTAGSGPFMLKSWQKGQQLVLVPNPHYPGNKPNFKRVSVKIIGESASRRLQLSRGDIDIADALPVDQLNALKQENKVNVAEYPSLRVTYLYLNNSKAPLNQADLRRAISWSTDYQGMVNGILSGNGKQMRGPIPEGMWGYDATAMQYNHDETKAKAEWDKVTNKPTSLTFLYSDNDPNWEPIALATQSSLNKLGINVKLEKLANATMRDRVGKGDYDIAIGNWSPDFADPYMFMNYWFESDKKGLPGNRSFYENSEVDKLLRNALATTDQTQRTRDYQQAQKIVINDAAYVYLFQKNYQLAMNKEVKGFVFNPMLEQVFNINTMSK